FGLARLVTLVARLEVSLEHEVAISHRPGVDGPGLDDPDRVALDGACRTQLVATPRQHHVVEATTCDQRAREGQPEAHGDGDAPLRAVVLGDHLPHMGPRGRLEGTDVAPAEVHAVVADVASAVEIVADHHAVATAHGQL